MTQFRNMRRKTVVCWISRKYTQRSVRFAQMFAYRMRWLKLAFALPYPVLTVSTVLILAVALAVAHRRDVNK